MRVVVTTDEDIEFRNYTVVQSLKEAVGIADKEHIDNLIIHKPKEASFGMGILLSDLHKKDVENFIYINENPDIQVKMLIDGLGGYTFVDEFYLYEEFELDALIENLHTETALSPATENIDIIKDFMQSFVRGEQKVNQQFYLTRTKEAIQALADITKSQELTITEMGNSSIQVFEKASEILRKMNTQKAELEQQLSHLEQLANSDGYSQSTKPLSNTINIFSPYSYSGNTKVLVVKEYTPCRFLTSFLLSYVHYIHYTLNKRSKLVVCYQKGYTTGKRYETMFITVGDETSNTMSSLYESELLATSSPKREVLKEIFSKQSDVVVVLDRTYGAERIVSGRVKFVLNAVGGAGDMERFNLNPNTIITSQTFPKSKEPFISLVPFKDYPIEPDVRYSAYDQQYLHKTEVFKLLDAKLELKKD